MREIKFRKPRTRGAYKGLVLIGAYLYIYLPSHPNAMHGKRYIGLHRLVCEWKLGRFLTNKEVAHHKNGNTLDNSPDNLEVLTISEHNKLTANSRKKDQYGKFTKGN